MTPARLNAYIFYLGNCREAMNFYHEIFGGNLEIRNISEIPGMELAEGAKDGVMHAHLSGGIVDLMGSDGSNTRTTPYGESMISLSITGTNEEELRAVYNALAEGGKATDPLKMEFWGDIFGTVTDKYGADWLITITKPAEEPAQ